MIIAINGAAATGKGTLARKLAARIGIVRYDFGMIFRMLAVLKQDLPWEEITRMIASNRLEACNDEILLDGNDVGPSLMNERVALFAASLAHSDERTLTRVARSLIKHKRFVVDGRTVSQVFREADLHFHLVVGPQEAKKRRINQGGDPELFEQRAALDKSRTNIIDKAILIDTDGRTPDQSFSEMLSHYAVFKRGLNRAR